MFGCRIAPNIKKRNAVTSGNLISKYQRWEGRLKQIKALIRNTDVDLDKLSTDLLLLRAMLNVADEIGKHNARLQCLQDYNASFRQRLIEFDSTLMSKKIDEVLNKIARLNLILGQRTKTNELPDHLTLIRWGLEEDIADILLVD
ncbi:hypothetical protein MTO96_009504 [Rhipicephalus appendiculatus]